MNTFGTRLRLTTFGESHGEAIGGVIDGMPSNVAFDLDFIQGELDKRKPGGKFATSRKESDTVRVLSGVFEGVTTGTPIAFIIENKNQHSSDYNSVKDLFRPGHADFGYFSKYGVRDYRGGGRSSARETAVRVAGGAIAGLLLREFGISVKSGVFSVGEVNFNTNLYEILGDLDFEYANSSEVFALNADLESKFKDEILKAKKSLDSVGASVLSIASGVPAGLGEALYDKTDSKLAHAMMGINGVKGVEIGLGSLASSKLGSQNNDEMNAFGFKTNFSGGMLGGITNGNDIIVKSYFKPTPSIFIEQDTITTSGEPTKMHLKGRHDPCIGIRGNVVATAMMRLVIADLLLLNASCKLENLHKIYD